MVFWARSLIITSAACLDLDVVLVNKTHLRESNTVNLVNYNIYRNNRGNRQGGGTVIFVWKSINHYVVDVGKLEKLEATAMEVVTASAETLRLISAYCPPNCILVAADLDVVLYGLQNATILVGDFNAKR